MVRSQRAETRCFSMTYSKASCPAQSKYSEMLGEWIKKWMNEPTKWKEKGFEEARWHATFYGEGLFNLWTTFSQQNRVADWPPEAVSVLRKHPETAVGKRVGCIRLNQDRFHVEMFSSVEWGNLRRMGPVWSFFIMLWVYPAQPGKWLWIQSHIVCYLGGFIIIVMILNPSYFKHEKDIAKKKKKNTQYSPWKKPIKIGLFHTFRGFEKWSQNKREWRDVWPKVRKSSPLCTLVYLCKPLNLPKFSSQTMEVIVPPFPSPELIALGNACN